jgi:hypothetical protein
MTAITYGRATSVAATSRPARGFWARLLDRFVEARMRQVEREIRNHLRFVPEDVLKEAGYRATLGKSKDLPFVK